MVTFADYAYYTANGGKLPEAAYNASVNDAYAEILSQTNGAALTALLEEYEIGLIVLAVRVRTGGRCGRLQGYRRRPPQRDRQYKQ